MLTKWGEVGICGVEWFISGIDSMLLLTGEYQHVLDDKGRVLVSNKLRSRIDVDEQG